MKRFTTLIALLSVMLAAFAQRPLVTLSHNGELSFFSNLSALEEALDSAQNGDIIYLSEGTFASSSDQIIIRKRVSIVGCGYKSHILPEILISTGSNNNAGPFGAPLFDGVRLQKLEFYAPADRDKLKEVEIRKTWIGILLNGGYGGRDLLINRCLIEYLDVMGATDNNTVIENSKILEIPKTPAYAITVINCNIKDTYYCPHTVKSSIISYSSEGYLGTNGTHTIIKSLLPSETFLGTTGDIKVYDCYFANLTSDLLDSNCNTNLNLVEKGYLGEDGKEVGVYGGEFPFSENPSVPTVDSANSKVEYDAENNKLNVTISVTPN